MASIRSLRGVAALVLVVSLAGCGGGGGDKGGTSNPPPQPATRTIGGTVTGLTGSGLVLRNNGGDNLAVSASGAFTFATSIAEGSAYAVTAFTQPSNPSQTCVVSNGSGTVGGSNVTNVQVACTTNTLTVGGTVSGLVGAGLVLQNNGGDNLAISANGAFTFATPVAQGNAYAVTAFAQPANPPQICVVNGGSGTVPASNVTNVQVVCTTNTFAIGGTLSGLTGTGLVVSNGSDRVTLIADGAFAFNTAVVSGARYNVVIEAAPTGPVQRCSVINGSGVAAANVSISVTCVAAFPTYAYGINRNDGTLSSYAIDASTGQLRARHNAKAGTRPMAAVTYKPSNGKQFTFVANQDSDNISAFAVDKRTGALDEVNGSPFATGGDEPRSPVLHPTRPFLYVPNENGTSIAAYNIDADTGELTSTGPVATGTAPQSFVIEATGRFAYVAAPGSSELYTYAINQTNGALTEVASSRIAIGSVVGGIALERDGRFLYVFNSTPGTISAYAINATSGLLTAIAGSPFNAGVNAALAGMHPNGKFIYVKHPVPTQTTASGLAVFAINGTSGALSEIAGSPFDAGANPIALSFDPTARYLYVGHLLGGGSPESNIRSYTVDATTGALTVMPGSPLTTSQFPSSLAVDGSGNYLYVTNQLTNQLTSYRIDSNGALSQLPATPATVGAQPNFVSVADATTPLKLSSKFVYAVNAAAITTHVFSIGDDGTLAPGTTAATGPTPLGVTLDPKGRYAYTANAGDNSISIYSVNPQTGELTAFPARFFGAGTAPSYIAIEPSGRYAYVAASTDILQFNLDPSTGGLDSLVSTNVGQTMNVVKIAPNGRWLLATTTSNNLVYSYTINSATGALTFASSVDTGGNVTSLALDAAGKFAYVTDAATGVLRMYTINSLTGALSPAGTYTTAGYLPDGVAFDPLGGFAFTADGATNNTVSMFRVQSNGAVTYVNSFAAGTNPIAVGTDYSGKFVCVVTAGGEVRTFAIDRDTPSLTPIDTDTMPGIANSGAVTLSTHAE